MLADTEHTSFQKTSPQKGEERDSVLAGGGGKMGTPQVYFGAASVLNSLAYL